MELISKDEVNKAINNAFNRCNDKQTAMAYLKLKDDLMELPAIESRPTGKWIDIIEPITNPKVNFFERLESRETPRAYKCDNCGRIVESKENFCPQCGENKEIRNERNMGK